MTPAAIDYVDLCQALRDLGFRLDAAEYHGVLCGMLCVQDNPPDDLGLERDSPADGTQVLTARRQLQQLRTTSLGNLSDPDGEFTPLLPDDDEDLNLRVEALAQWCDGFLYGLANRPALDLKQGSVELREIISDLVQISRAGVEDEEDPDENADENAFMELVEYVRAGVQLVFLELRTSGPETAQPGTIH